MEERTIQIKLEKSENSCFIVMPFNPLFQTQYENVIQPVVSELGLKCIRGDEIYSKQRIMDDIWDSIKTCRLVIAELTGRNPNVLYEIGLAHAIGKPVIIITRNGEDVPFDLKDLRYLFYDTDDPFWGQNLKIGLKTLISKVLESPKIGSYLPGIETGNIDYPKLIEPKPTKAKPKQKYNLTGIWSGAWADKDKTNHNIIMHITQIESSISATATINYIKNDSKLNVVQEILNGSIKDSKVLLQGVNYSYIKREDSTGYNLDQFEFHVENDNKMQGTSSDGLGAIDSDLILLRQNTLPNNVYKK